MQLRPPRKLATREFCIVLPMIAERSISHQGGRQGARALDAQSGPFPSFPSQNRVFRRMHSPGLRTHSACLRIPAHASSLLFLSLPILWTGVTLKHPPDSHPAQRPTQHVVFCLPLITRPPWDILRHAESESLSNRTQAPCRLPRNRRGCKPGRASRRIQCLHGEPRGDAEQPFFVAGAVGSERRGATRHSR